MNLLLTGQWDDVERDAWAAALRLALPAGDRLVLRRGEVDDATIEVAIVANPSAGSLAGLPALRLIQSLWAGVDRLLGDASLPTGVPIARMVDPAMNAAMAETALWAVLSLHRGFFDYAAQQQARVWHQASQWRADEVPVLVLGCGQMGRAAAQRLVQHGYPVSAWARSADGPDQPGVARLHGDAALLPAVSASRIVVNLLPLTAQTRGVLDARLFEALPSGGAIVNLARGAHLVEADLLVALASGRVDRAVLDVFAVEPLPGEHPFWRHPRITMLPHVAAQTDLRSASAVVVGNLRALAEGRPVAHRVLPERGY